MGRWSWPGYLVKYAVILVTSGTNQEWEWKVFQQDPVHCGGLLQNKAIIISTRCLVHGPENVHGLGLGQRIHTKALELTAGREQRDTFTSHRLLPVLRWVPYYFLRTYILPLLPLVQPTRIQVVYSVPTACRHCFSRDFITKWRGSKESTSVPDKFFFSLRSPASGPHELYSWSAM